LAFPTDATVIAMLRGHDKVNGTASEQERKG
jgi:hypothetical protein